MSSILKVDTIQDQSGNNIINESGNVITIGASGDTITVPAGATVSGFTSAGIDDNATSTAITISSGEDVTFTENILLGDSKKALFGAGSDLQIYHDGSNSYVDDTGTGDLLIRGSARILLRKAGTTENMIRCEADDYVKLYHNNVEKLSTTSGGITVTGATTITGGGVNVEDGYALNWGDNSYRIEGKDDGANARIGFVAGGSEKGRFDNSGNFFVATTTESSDDVGHALLASGAAYHTADGTYAGLFNRKSSDGEIVQIRRNNTLVGSLDTVGVSSSGRLVVKSTTFDGFLDRAGTTIAKWMQSSFTPGADNNFDLGRTDERWQDIYLSGGAFIGGTGTANQLSDYEEGTWTPALDSVGQSNASGQYTKIGNVCTAKFRISSDGSGSNINITGFPFNATSATGEQQGLARETQTSGKLYFIRISASNTVGTIIRYDANNSITSNDTFEGQITYITNT